MKRSGVHGQDGPISSASRRDASVGDAMSCTTESSLRDSIIMYHAYPVTPRCSMAGYFQHALTGSEGNNLIVLNSTALIGRAPCFAFPAQQLSRFFPASMPQAAIMSSPRDARIVAVMPSSLSRSRNAIMRASGAVCSGEPGIA